MEFLLGLATGYLLTWPGFIILLILGTIAESNDAHGIAAFFGIVAAVTAYFFFHIDPAIIAIYIGAYFVIGFGWSIWRYKRHALDVVEQEKRQSEYSRKLAIERLHPTKMLGTLTTWVFIWPFSMVENVSGDLIKLVQTTITKFLKSIYHRIYNNAVGQLMPEETKE